MDRFAATAARDNIDRAIAAAHGAYGDTWQPDTLAIAPGRIELLGNHLDYNGGPVLAAAIDRFVVVASRTESGAAPLITATIADVPGRPTTTIDADNLRDWTNPHSPPDSIDYVRGIVAALTGRPDLTARIPSSLAVAGDVPIGFGVSSSAALCVGLALALAEGFARPAAIVLLAQEAEHRAGTPCGTMDQSASVAGGVIAFDGETLSVEHLSPSLGDLVFAVADSGVERSLGASSYPLRVEESRMALDLARIAINPDLPNLAALDVESLDELIEFGVLPETLAKRARHIVEETARVAAGREAMLAGDWAEFGRLMTASGRSSATLYEISHPRVEELVAEALRVPGVLGARMMGGGEGGTALLLLPTAAVPALESALRAGYYRTYGMADREGLIHTCAFAPGATLVPASELG
ncbi:MAG: galactokinase family protein [Thermomicrobiales bacterium]